MEEAATRLGNIKQGRKGNLGHVRKLYGRATCPTVPAWLLRRIAQQKEGMKESFGLLEAVSEHRFPDSWEWDTEWHFAFLELRRALVKQLLFSVFG